MDNQPTALVRCPACRQPSDSLKQYTMPKLVVFLVFAASTQRATYTCCPSCMRKVIGKNLAINIIPSNLIWPLLAIYYLGATTATFTKGHSKAVRKELGL